MAMEVTDSMNMSFEQAPGDGATGFLWHVAVHGRRKRVRQDMTD